MVGLPDASVRESRDRVRSAIRNSGFEFPPHRITVNLAPADVRKAGAFPLLTVGSDRMFKKYYEEVPEKYDSQAPELDLKLAMLPSVTINIDSNESDDVAAGT